MYVQEESLKTTMACILTHIRQLLKKESSYQWRTQKLLEGVRALCKLFLNIYFTNLCICSVLHYYNFNC